jgi:hypothetical protein
LELAATAQKGYIDNLSSRVSVGGRLSWRSSRSAVPFKLKKEKL